MRLWAGRAAQLKAPVLAPHAISLHKLSWTTYNTVANPAGSAAMSLRGQANPLPLL